VEAGAQSMRALVLLAVLGGCLQLQCAAQPTLPVEGRIVIPNELSPPITKVSDQPFPRHPEFELDVQCL
jgi:hypothetical protein